MTTDNENGGTKCIVARRHEWELLERCIHCGLGVRERDRRNSDRPSASPPVLTTVPSGTPTFGVYAGQVEADAKIVWLKASGMTVGSFMSIEGKIVVFWF